MELLEQGLVSPRSAVNHLIEGGILGCTTKQGVGVGGIRISYGRGMWNEWWGQMVGGGVGGKDVYVL